MDWGTIHCKPVLPLIVKKHGKKCCPLLEFYSQMFRVIMCRNWATLKGAIDVAKWKCSLLSHVWLSATPWPVAHQAPLSMGFSRREAWSGLPFPPPDDFPTQGMNLCLLKFLHCRRILYCWAPGEAPCRVHPVKQSCKQTCSHDFNVQWSIHVNCLLWLLHNVILYCWDF